MANNYIPLSKVFTEAVNLIEDLAGSVIEMNQVTEQTFGWTHEVIVGRPIIPPERHKQADDLLAQCKWGDKSETLKDSDIRIL